MAEKKIDPFTRTPGIAGRAYIYTGKADTVIGEFESDISSKYVYKITGQRGSGKSVEYREIINYFQKQDGWLVYTLSAAGEPTRALIAQLGNEDFIDTDKKTETTTAGVEGSGTIAILGVKGQGSRSTTRSKDEIYMSEEAVLDKCVKTAIAREYKILVGIDDIAKTPEVVRFLSLYGKLITDYQGSLYFLCTGLAHNIKSLPDSQALTFFKCGDSIVTDGLNLYAISKKYQTLLDLDKEDAMTLAKICRGYAYAYQALGSIYFNRSSDDTLEDVLMDFDEEIIANSYDYIWNGLTKAEQDLVRIILSTVSGKVSDIKERMDKPNNFMMLRSRLAAKHLLCTKKRGYATIELPRFKEFVEEWKTED